MKNWSRGYPKRLPPLSAGVNWGAAATKWILMWICVTQRTKAGKFTCTCNTIKEGWGLNWECLLTQLVLVKGVVTAGSVFLFNIMYIFFRVPQKQTQLSFFFSYFGKWCGVGKTKLFLPGVGEHGQLIICIKLHILWIIKCSTLLWSDTNLDSHSQTPALRKTWVSSLGCNCIVMFGWSP